MTTFAEKDVTEVNPADMMWHFDPWWRSIHSAPESEPRERAAIAGANHDRCIVVTCALPPDDGSAR